ncbi:9202_t:CDS:2 [Ambispora gerdemannii]|uniref:9202_t:CDS:1 n=1 Tax=Ambispora gerdemannii TaxID=144530 RepID=A0A9N8Z849_9GLOM|nr:9202_t:CDS:2 [Ambispora gerdemannii]
MYTKITAKLFFILLLVSFVLSAPAPQNTDQYKNLIGKTLVLNGHTDPQGVPRSQLVYEHQLPPYHRLRYPDTYVTLEYDPDR